MTRTSSLSERGFALPLTLFVVAMITILLSVALVQVQVDRRLAESAADQVSVMSLARSGLERYLATVNVDGCQRPLRPRDGDSVRINLTGGYAEVVARVAQKPATDTLAPWTYVVRSAGRMINAAMGADPQAARTVAQYANWSSGWIDPLGAFVAANGLTRSPTGTCSTSPIAPICGELNGTDQHPVTSCRAPVPRLYVAGSLPPLGTDYNQSGLAAVATGCNTKACKAAVAAATNIDWGRTIGGGVIPDYHYIQTWDASYPISLVVGDATLGSAGAWTYGWGLLIVTGDLTTVGAGTQWYGVVLVGGKINFGAVQQFFDGMVVSGLNAQLGQDPPEGSIGGYYTDFDYDSYYVHMALQKLAGFGPIANTTIENWATY